MTPVSRKSDPRISLLPRKILIVDDDLHSIATLTQILLQNGYEVLHAEDNDRAAKIARLSRPDMIICNADSKKVNALQFLKLMREGLQTRNAAILVLTEQREILEQEPGLLAPAQLLMRPFTREQLAIAVQENLRHRRGRER